MTVEKYREALSRVSLNSIEEVKGFQGPVLSVHQGCNDTSKMTLEDPVHGAVTLFLKRNWKMPAKNGVASLLRRGAVWSLAREEWTNLCALRAAGIRTGEPIAYGEECGIYRERFSYLVTISAGEESLEHFLMRSPGREELRRVLQAVAGFVRGLHGAGFTSPDLFAKHLFLSGIASGAPTVAVIDMARMNYSNARRFRARDLAALHASIPMRLLPVRDRVRFLKEYAGTVDRELVTLVRRRMRVLLKRKKFQGFLASD